MNIFLHQQQSFEWWQFKIGKIGGTRFGKVISGKKNRLVYELMNEILDNRCADDDFISDEMQYGIDNESEAIALYEKETGNKVERVGAVISDLNPGHIASVDGLTCNRSVAIEVKCTMNGDIHLQRYFEGVDSNYLPQCINNFAVSDEIKEVHFVSYCGYRPERPMLFKVLKREEFEREIAKGLKSVDEILSSVKFLLDEYQF